MASTKTYHGGGAGANLALIAADTNPLDGIAAFRAFTAGIRERCDEPPTTVDLAEIGAFGL